MSDMSTLIARLEAATLKLEGLSGGAPVAAAASSDDGDVSASVEAYDEFMSEYVEKFSAAANAIGGTVAEHGALVKSAFVAQRAFLVAASKSKKPADADVAVVIKPQSDAISAIQEYKNKSKDRDAGNHLAAVADCIAAIGWVVQTKPAPFVKSMAEGGEFYANRVIKEFKGKDEKHMEWARSLKAIWAPLSDYAKKFHTTGVVYNANGGDLKAALASGASAAPAPSAGGPPPPPPPGPAPAPVAASAPTTKVDTSALFAALNSGSAITSGLKKVDRSQMTHKNPELRGSSLVPAASAKKAPAASKKAAAGGKTYPPKFEHLAGKKFDIEYYKGDKTLEIKDPQPQENVILYKCEDCVLKVNGKVNNIVLNQCKKVAVVFDTVVSTVEVNNCQRIQLQCLGMAPIVTIDKTDGFQLYLNENSLHTEVISAQSSEMNISVPGEPNEEDADAPVDPKEHSLPEQYKSVYDEATKTFITECVIHA